MKTFLNISVAAVAILGLAACATKSNVKADGTMDNPVFPELIRSLLIMIAVLSLLLTSWIKCARV